MSTPVYAVNCQVCGEERLSVEVMPIRLGSHSFSRINTCLACIINNNDVLDDFKESANLIIEVMREAATQAK